MLNKGNKIIDVIHYIYLIYLIVPLFAFMLVEFEVHQFRDISMYSFFYTFLPFLGLFSILIFFQ